MSLLTLNAALREARAKLPTTHELGSRTEPREEPELLRLYTGKHLVVIFVKSQPGLEAALSDQGHGGGFIIRVGCGGGTPLLRTERSSRGIRRAQACKEAARIILEEARK